MDLQELKFRVVTDELDTAIQKVDKLGDAVEKINTPVQQLAKNTKEAASGVDQLSRATDNSGKATGKAVDAAEAFDKLLQKLKNTHSDLANGFTRGESAVLNQARAMGVFGNALDPVINVLKEIKTLSKDPFDAAIGSVRSITAEFDQLTTRANLANQGISLTVSQLREYSKIANEVRGKLMAEGLKPETVEYQARYNILLAETQTEYLGIAAKVNQVTAAEKLRNDELKASEKAEIERSIAIAKTAEGVEKQYRAFSSSIWKDYASDIGKTTNEMKQLNSYFSEMAKDADASAAKLEKINTELRQNTWKEYASSIGQTSNELKGLNADYAKFEQESKAAATNLEKIYSDLRSSTWKEYADGIGRTSDEMKQLNAYYREQEQTAAALDKQRFNAMSEKQQKTRVVISMEEQLLETEKKLAFQNEQLARGFTVASANALQKYIQALKEVGIVGNEAKQKIYQFEQALMQKQSTSPFSKMTEHVKTLDNSVNHLARNIGVQFTDIGVSLANGQSLFQVITQQGGQLADAFLLAGVEGGKMGNKLVEGAKAIFASYKMLGTAFLDLGGKAIKGLGDAISGLVMKTSGANLALDMFRRNAAASGEAGFALIGTINRIAASASILAGIVGSITILLGGAFLASLIQADMQQTKLAKSLGQYGASLGLTTEQVQRFATESDVSTSKFIDATTAIAKAGGFTKDQLVDVAETAVAMNKVFGTSIDEVVGKFKDLQKEPLEGLLKLQQETGRVNSTTIELIQTLVNQGRSYEAVNIAIAEYKRASKDAADSTIENLGYIETFLNKLARAWDSFYKGIQNFGKATLSEKIQEAAKELDAALKLQAAYAGKKGAGGDAADANRRVEEAKKAYEALAKAVIDESDAMVESRRRESEAASWRLKNSKELQATYTEESKYLKEVSRLQVEYAKGIELGASDSELLQIRNAMVKATKDYSDALAKANKPSKEANELLKYYNSSLERAKDTVIQATGKTVELTKAEKVRMDLFDDPLWKKLDENQRKQILNILETADVLEKEANARKKVREEWEKTIKAQTEKDKKFFDVSDDFSKYGEELRKSSKELDFQKSIIGKTSREVELITREYNKQNKLIEAKVKLEEDLIKAQGNTELREQAYRNYDEKVRQINQETANLAAQDYQKAFDEIQSTVSDIIATALFEGGKAGQKKLKDVLKNAFKNFVINVVINPITQGITTSLSRSFGSTSSSVSGTGTGQGFDFGGSIVSGVNNIGSFLYNNGQGLFGSDMLASLGSSIQGFSYDVAGFSDAIGSFGGYLNAFNLALDGNYGSAAGAAIGTYIMPGIGTVVGEWLGSFADGLFGNAGTPHTGGVGSYSAAQGALTGSAADQWVNFDPNKRASAWNSEANTASANMAQITATMLDGLAQSFGQQAGYLVGTGFQDDSSSDGAWGALKIALGDQVLLDWGRGRDKWPGREFANGQAGQQGYLTALATDVRSVLMDIAPAWADDILNALGDAPTMDQLTTALAEIQKILFVFDNLGSAMSQLSNISDDAQGALMRVAGGIDNLTSLVSNYYDQYYSESEKLSFQTEKLKAQFEALGLEMPTSREGFRVLVESMNLSTQSGRETYIALLGLADAFASITPAIEDFTANIQDLISSLTSSYSSMADLESQIAAKEAELARQAQLDSLKSQQDALNEQLKTVQGLLQAARSLRTYVQSLKLGQLSSLTTQQKLDEFSSLYQKQLQAAKSGDITAFSDIQGTTSGFLEAYKSQAVTSTDYARQFMKMTNELDALGKTTEDVNASIEVELLNKLKDIDSEISSLSTTADNSLAQLKAQLDQAKKQFIQDLANTTQQVIATDNVADVLGQLPSDLAAILSTSLANTLNPLFNSLASAITAGTSVKASSSAISSAIGSASTGTNTIAGSQADLVKNIVTSALPDTSYSYTDKAQLVTNLMNQGYTGSSITQMMVDTYGVSVQSEMDKLTQAAAINDIYNTVFGRTADQSGLDYWTNQLNTGAVSTSNIVNAIIGGAQNQDITNTNLSTLSGYIPKFADGGSYLGGLALVGEEGPELINFNQPGQVYTANQTSNLMQSDNSALLEELRSLREEVVMLRAETRATVSNTSKTAKILDRVVRGEDTVNTVVVA